MCWINEENFVRLYSLTTQKSWFLCYGIVILFSPCIMYLWFAGDSWRHIVTDWVIGAMKAAREGCRVLAVSHYRIASSRKVSPADNFPEKIRPARRPPERDGFLPVNSRPGRLFLGVDPIMGKLFGGTGDILEREDISVIMFLRANFSWGRHFNVTPA